MHDAMTPRGEELGRALEAVPIGRQIEKECHAAAGVKWT
jgi:hypothetical protein